MNIFVLDYDPVQAAQYHNNKHVCKMIVETAQILSTALRNRDYVKDLEQGLLYNSTHVNHPCVKWATSSTGNCAWLLRLGYALAEEYTFRYGKIHASVKKLDAVRDILAQYTEEPMTEFVQCVPDDCKNEDPVQAYRFYYVIHKQHIAKWNKREMPSWWRSHV